MLGWLSHTPHACFSAYRGRLSHTPHAYFSAYRGRLWFSLSCGFLDKDWGYHILTGLSGSIRKNIQLRERSWDSAEKSLREECLWWRVRRAPSGYRKRMLECLRVGLRLGNQIKCKPVLVKKNLNHILLILCIWVHSTHVPCYNCGGQRTTSRRSPPYRSRHLTQIIRLSSMPLCC